MKRIALVLAASSFLTAAAIAQAPATGSKPAAADDAVWSRVMELPRGQPIVVKNTYGPPLRCRFDGATDGFLFCYPPDGSPNAAEEYQFDRASVLDVRVARGRLLPHPGVLASAAVAGIVLGLGSTRTLKDPDASTVGLITAIVVGSAGYGMAQIPRPGMAWGFAYHPRRFVFRRRPILRRFAPYIP